MRRSRGRERAGLKPGPRAEQAVAPQVTQLYVPASRSAWRFRRMGRIGPLRSTLDGECPVPAPGLRAGPAGAVCCCVRAPGSWPVVSDFGQPGQECHCRKAPRAWVAGPHRPPGSPGSAPCARVSVSSAWQRAAPSLEGTGGLTGRSLVAVGLESPPLSVSEERQLAILTQLPFVVPFEERVKVCFQLVLCRLTQPVQCEKVTPVGNFLKPAAACD